MKKRSTNIELFTAVNRFSSVFYDYLESKTLKLTTKLIHIYFSPSNLQFFNFNRSKAKR